MNPWQSRTPVLPPGVEEGLRARHHWHAAVLPRCCSVACARYSLESSHASRRARTIVTGRAIGAGWPGAGPGLSRSTGIDSRRSRGTMWSVFYWVVKAILGPILALVFRPVGRGDRERAARGPGHPGQQPPVVLRPLLRPAAAAAQGDLPRQVRVLHRPRAEGPDQQGVLPRGRADSGGPVRRRGQRAGAARPACACWPRASCSASTRRAPGPRTAGCTGARPGWPGSRWSPAHR